jgi:hypothetical protein
MVHGETQSRNDDRVLSQWAVAAEQGNYSPFPMCSENEKKLAYN